MSKEILAKKLNDIEKALKDIPGVHLHDIRNFINGNVSVTKKGSLKIPLDLPSKELLEDPMNAGQVISGQWKIVPILVFVSDEQN